MKNFLELIYDTVVSKPDKIAYKVRNSSITYCELWDQACLYAKHLQVQGSSPVLLYGQKEVDVIISIMACLMAHRAYVPISYSTPLSRIIKIAGLTGSNLVITDKKLDIPGVACKTLKEIDTAHEMDECADFTVKTLSPDLSNNGQDDIAYIIFTSGSTGEPKGVPISRGNLNNFVNWISGLKPLSEYKDIRVLNQASFSFDLSVADLYYSLCNGHTLIAYDDDLSEGLDSLYDIFVSEKIDVAVMTPTFMKLCLLNSDFNADRFPDFKCVYFCGELLENKTVREISDRFPELKVINAYGPTEATSAVSAILITPEMLEKEELLPVGETSSFAVNIEIIDDEIVLKGDSVFGGYISDIKGGYYLENNVNCYRTGDIGFISDGKLYCKGRKDSQVKFKGYRIELSDIENNLAKISGIKDCAVVAKYNGNIVKTIKAFVIVEKNVTIEYIKQELSKLIPGYMMPKTIKILENFPVNHNGKTDRKALSEL